jgi:hypothetical protein
MAKLFKAPTDIEGEIGSTTFKFTDENAACLRALAQQMTTEKP